MGYVHEEEFSEWEFNLKDIKECESVKQLLEWYEETTTGREDMKCQIEAAVLSGHYDDKWMESCKKAYAFAGMGASRVRSRLKSMGVNPDYPENDVDKLLRGLEKSKETLAKARASASFGHHLLGAIRDTLPEDVVTKITALASARATARDSDSSGIVPDYMRAKATEAAS